jgi:hypothetical protein
VAYYFLIISAMFSAWAFLTVIGGERTRLLQDLKQRAPRSDHGSSGTGII